jgi:hypothetical protein
MVALFFPPWCALTYWPRSILRIGNCFACEASLQHPSFYSYRSDAGAVCRLSSGLSDRPQAWQSLDYAIAFPIPMKHARSLPEHADPRNGMVAIRFDEVDVCSDPDDEVVWWQCRCI